MPKNQVIPLNKEEIDELIDASAEDDFCYMLFNVAKTTGRRLGEFYGVQRKEKIGEKTIGFKGAYDIKGNKIQVTRTVPVFKKFNEWSYGVRVEDINFGEGTMKIWVLKRRRYDQDETILTPEVLRLIRQYIIKNKLSPDKHLFRKYSYRQIQNKVKVFARKSGLEKNVSFHNFRHYFISELSRQGWSHDKIAKLTGHRSLSTLGIYDHIVAKDLKQDVQEAMKQL